MPEYLAIPCWNAPRCSIEAWIEQFEQRDHPVARERDGNAGVVLVVESLETEAYAALDGDDVVAIDFTCAEACASAFLNVLDRAARELGWEWNAHEEDEIEGD